MRLQSAKDLKAELLENVVVPFDAAARPGAPAAMRARAVPGGADVLAAESTFAVAARPPDELPKIHRSVALGIATRGDDYRLAVRVQRQALMGSALVEHIVKQAKGEADVRLIGRVEKRPGVEPHAPARRNVYGPGTSRGTTARAETADAALTASAALPWYRQNARPLLIGASVGHVDVTAGTIGGFVRRARNVCILSNNHVIANEDLADRDDPVIQRGRFDGGRNPRDHVAALRYVVRLKTTGANFVDAAAAEIEDGIAYDPNRLRGIAGGADRRLAGVGPDMLDAGETVHKVGRTTGATKGRVTAFDVDNLIVSYDVGNLRFDNQVEIEGAGTMAFSDGGDSGSLIVNAGMEAVALLFAGGDTGGTNGLGLTYASPISQVLKRLKATLLF